MYNAQKKTMLSRYRNNSALCYLLTGLLLLLSMVLKADDGSDVLDRIIHIEKKKDTVYRLLGNISEQSGLLFIYDSKIIDNEKKVAIKKGDYTIRQAIYQITGNERFELRVIGNHILISLPVETNTISTLPPANVEKKEDEHFILEGILQDKSTGLPIETGTIGVMNTSIGSVTNSNGEFRIVIPDSLRNAQIVFSHLGYEQQIVEATLLTGTNRTIGLEAKVFPIQEVLVRVVNPLRLLRDMHKKRTDNYSHIPVYMTTFYREGIERKNKFVSLTEAVFKVYKASCFSNNWSDQVKLLKMRRITNRFEKDTVIAKMKSGINACLMLDIMRNLPDFLLPDDNAGLYSYAPTDITVIENRLANVIYFEQKEGIHEPLYRGELYLDSENSALLRARFEIHPKYVEKAAGMLVEKVSRNLSITPQKVVYTVSYKSYNGTYYINHIRGDLYFKIKKRRQLFSSTPLHTWFEIVTCKIDTQQATRFSRNEVLPTRTVFSETNFSYDDSFWGNFNVIPPEEKLNEAISLISSKIEETSE